MKAEIQGHSIVLIGSFNPPIFQPSWFAARGLVPQAEADAAKVGVISTDVVQFSFDWAQVQVLQEQFVVTTVQAHAHELVRDLVLGTFRVLRYTPIKMLGINVDNHFRMKSEETWHEVGHKLAPKEFWNRYLLEPGLRSMTMQGKREKGPLGHTAVRVEPSQRIKPGVFINVNDHYEFPDAKGADEAVALLEQNWKVSMDRSLALAEGVSSVTHV